MTIGIDLCFIFKIVFIVVLFCSIFLYIFSRTFKTSSYHQWDKEGHILFLIAHPDDECMFFAPTIQRKCCQTQSSLLCFTTGNYENKGAVRKKEILKSCQLLGIPSERCTVLNITCLPDNPDIPWDQSTVCQEILKNCQQNNITQIYTFDDYGVSGHNNHKELYHAVRYLKVETRQLDGIRCYSLESVSILRKYISFLDVPYSLYTADIIFISPPSQVFNAQKAMYAHWSQFVWFRIAFVLFSRYLLINTFKEIKFNKVR